MTATFIPQWTTADRLRKAREAACLDQLELADRIGVARQTINNYERGRTTNYRRIVMNQWALATGVPVEWLTEGTVGPNTPSDQGISQSGCIADIAA